MSEIKISKEHLSRLIADSYEKGMINGYNLAIDSAVESLKLYKEDFNIKLKELIKEPPCQK